MLMSDGLPADWSIFFRHVMRTSEELATLLVLEEQEGRLVQPPIGSEEALTRRRVRPTPTLTAATEEGNWSSH